METLNDGICCSVGSSLCTPVKVEIYEQMLMVNKWQTLCFFYQIEVYARQLQEMEDLFKGTGGDDAPVNDAQMERAIRAAEVMVQNLEFRANELTSMKILFFQLV